MWISTVYEYLPKPFENVLVATECGNICSAHQDATSIQNWRTSSGDIIRDTVTHWMYLPPHPSNKPTQCPVCDAPIAVPKEV